MRLLLLAFLITANCQAQEIVLHGLSKHETLSGTKFNERNYGLGLRYNVSRDLSVQAGRYKNSYDKYTNYTVAQYTPIHYSNVSIGGFAGVATNYPSGLGVGGFMLNYKPSSIGVTVRAVPRINSKTASVVSVELSWSI